MKRKIGIIDLSASFSTGEYCENTSWYVCKYHPYIDKWVKKGDSFPKCEKANCGNTEWQRFNKT